MANHNDFRLLKVGHCMHPEAMIMPGGSLKAIRFPSIVAVLKHPSKGVILFDTGYAKRFQDATSCFPNCLYRWLTPMHLCEKEQLGTQLAELGIQHSDINAIVISHFHADHISGLLDFPHAELICSRTAYENFIRRSGLNGLIKGYLPALWPENGLSRLRFIEDSKTVNLANALQPFKNAYDIFGDGFALAIPLPGHAHGHIGLLCHDQHHSRFLVADACWTEKAFKENAKPKRITGLVMDNYHQYIDTLSKISYLFNHNPDINIIPSHCESSYMRWCHE